MASVHPQKNKTGTTWRVLWRQDGKQQSMSGFIDKPSAERFKTNVDIHGPDEAKRILAAEEAGARVHTVREWLTEHVDSLSGVQPATINRYKRYIDNDITAEFGSLPITAVSERSISRWVQALQIKRDDDGNAVVDDDGNPVVVAGKTIQNKHGFVSGALNAAVRAGLIESNPCIGRRLPETQREDMVFLTAGEFKMLRSCIKQPRWRDLATWLVTTGMRFSEATALGPDDIDLTARTCRINKAWKYSGTYHPEIGPPKTKKSRRTISLSREALAVLDLDQPRYLFTNGAGNPVRAQEFYNLAWKPARERAMELGLKKKPRVHDLRHTHASWLVHEGHPLPVIQARLGHENISTTISLYYHVDQRAEQQIAATIDTLLTDPIPENGSPAGSLSSTGAPNDS